MNKKPPKISPDELKERVLYSLLGAATRLAEAFEFPMKSLSKWLEVAYYHEFKDRELSQGDIAEIVGVSRRKIADLAKKLRQNFMRPETEATLPRKIEFILWAGKQPEGRIHQILDAPDEDIDRALEQLVDEQRVIKNPGRTTYYEVPRQTFRLYDKNWVRKIDALDNHLANVVDGIYARFFNNDDRAGARTVTFRVNDEDIDEIEKLYEETIFPKLVELEKRTADPDDRDDGVTEMSLSVNWAPYEYAKRVATQNEDGD